MLTIQYRMVPGLIEYSSKTFNKGAIKSGADIQPHGWIKWPNANWPIIFVNIKGEEVSDGKSCSNLKEAQAVVNLVARLMTHSKIFVLGRN